MSINRKGWLMFFLILGVFFFLDGKVYAEEKVLFSDDFSNPSDSDAKWILTHWGEKDQAKIENGMLVLNGEHIQAVIAEQTFKDFIIEVKMKVIKFEKKKDAPYHCCFSGIGFRKSTPQDRWGGYFFTLSYDRYKKIWLAAIIGGKIQDGQRQIPLDEEPLDKWYTLKLVVKGSNFKGYVNGELLIDINDSAFQSGYICLTQATWNIEFVCAFKDVKVYSPDLSK